MARILIVDDHEVVRDGIKRIVEEHLGPNQFGEAGTPVEALRLAVEHEWDAAIIDLSLGTRSGLEVLRDIRERRPRLPVLILSMHAEDQYARRAFRAGAAGYVTKDSSRAELGAAIRKVMSGSRYVSRTLAEQLATDLSRGSDEPSHEMLSDREFQVLRLIASGRSVTEIADVLALSDKTISTYRTRILEKMGMKTNAELTRYAIQNRLVE